MEALSSYTEDAERFNTQELGVYGAEFAAATTTQAPKRRPSPKHDVVTTSTSQNKIEWRNVTRLGSEIDVTLARLRSFKTWETNWDGEGSPAPDREQVERAVELYALLLNTRARFRATLGGDGVPLLFLKNSEVSGEISVESDNKISYVFKSDEGERVFEDFDVGFDGVKLPEELKNFLNSIRS